MMAERKDVYGSVEVTLKDKTRLNRVRGEEDLKTYSETLTFLLDKYFRG